MSMTVRTESLVMLAICGLMGVVFAYTRGFWSAAPVLVIASTGLVLHMLRPIPKEQPGLTWWAGANLAGLVVALAATWFQSSSMLIVGLLLVGIAIAVPSLQRRS